MKYFVFIVATLLINNVFSQNDTAITHKVEKSSIVFPINGDYKFKSIDTVLNEFYHYNPDGKELNVFLGNPGLALDSMKLKSLNYGIKSGEFAFNKLHTNFYGDYIYKTNVPFVRAGYIVGPKKLQDFSVLYSQNYNSRFNISAGFRTFGADGFYLNQKTTARIFSGQVSYSTKKDKYGFLVKYVVKSGLAGENGGVKRDSLNASIFQGNKLGVQVELEEATNHYDIRKVHVGQYLNIFKSDSVNGRKKSGSFMLNTVGFVSDYWFNDTEPDSIYYSRFGISLSDKERYADKFHEFGLNNEFSYQYSGFKNDVKLRIGAGSNWSEFMTIARDTMLNENYGIFSLSDLYLGKVIFTGEFKKGVSGYNHEGYSSHINFTVPIKKEYFIAVLRAKSQKSLPEVKYQFYSGTDLSWFETLDYSTLNEVSTSIISKSLGLKFDGQYGIVDNYTYYDSLALPKQYNQAFSQYSFKLSKKIRIKSYYFDLGIVHQQVDESAPVNVPEWTWMISFYYQRYLFKGAMELRYGIDYWQNTKYYANNYAPFIRAFTYQDQYQVGDYPYLNFYISARIKGAQGFVNFQNLSQLVLQEPNYMMAPFYPMQDFGISVGLRWDFYN